VNSTFSRRAQTATEYLILLAVVIIIAVIVVTAMGGIPSIGGGAGKSTSKVVLSTQPVGVTAWVVDTLGTKLRLRNNLPETINVHSIILDGSEISVNKVLSIGETTDVYHFGKYKPSQTKYTYNLAIYYTDVTSGARYLQNKSDLLISGTSSEGAGTLSADLMDGLHAWWRFDEDFSDVSGNGHDGTAVNDATLSSSSTKMGGGSLLLDGTDDEVTIDPDIDDLTNDFSVLFWAKLNGGGGDQTVFHHFVGAWPASGFLINLNEAALQGVDIYWWNGGAYQNYHRGPSLDFGEWYHVAVTLDSSNIWRIYVNGTYHASLDEGGVSYDSGPGVTRIGNGLNDFNGSIDDVMIFSRALSASKINQIYEMGR
jgi:hypothetical protein